MILELTFACGESSLSVSRFAVREAVSSLFTLSIRAHSASPTLDLEAIIGQPTGFRLASEIGPGGGGARSWTGVSGAFLIETGKGGGGTPVADVKGVARHDAAFGDGCAERWLGGDRAGRRTGAFETSAVDLRPGVVFSMSGHPHAELGESAELLVTEFALEGAPHEEAWQMSGRAVFADAPYHPPLTTPKPRVDGVQSATVVGPAGQEIHTDELGRVRVQFPWDREGKARTPRRRGPRPRAAGSGRGPSARTGSTPDHRSSARPPRAPATAPARAPPPPGAS